MPRKKEVNSSETDTVVETEDVAQQELTTSKDKSIVEAVETTAEATEGKKSTKAKKEKSKSGKTRERVPRKLLHIVIDAGRSRVKVIAVYNGGVTEVIILDSLITELDYELRNEKGAFTSGKLNPEFEEPKSVVHASAGEPDENGKIPKPRRKKDIAQNWVVGENSENRVKQVIAIEEKAEYKVKYFPLLLLGAISSIPNLFELSSGLNDKNRRLHIKLSTLSLAEPHKLREALGGYKWIKKDGVKYSLSFGKNGEDYLSFPEGYGASLYYKSLNKPEKDFLVFDIGFGTATVTKYDNRGSLPAKSKRNPHSGGGIAFLVHEFASQGNLNDSAQSLKPSEAKLALEDSEWIEGNVKAEAKGLDLSQALTSAIQNWMSDSPLTGAINELSLYGRKCPIVCCGGGFAIATTREMLIQELERVGIPKENLIIPGEPGTVALSQMETLFKGEENDSNRTQQAA